MNKILLVAVTLAIGATISVQPAQASWWAGFLDVGNAAYCNSIGNIFRVAGGSKWGDDFVDACTGMWYQ